MNKLDRRLASGPAPRLRWSQGGGVGVSIGLAAVPHPSETESRRKEEPERPRTELLMDPSMAAIGCNEAPDRDCERALDPYRGCEHGCIYCHTRPGHTRLGYSPGVDFETRILHKPAAARLLQAELAAPEYRCIPIALGSAGDAYQPYEGKLGITRSVLEILLATRHPVSVITKSALIIRDIDLWSELARQGLARVALTLTSLDKELSRQLEPRASATQARLEAIERLAAAGIPVTVVVAPVIPALNDHELETLLAAAHQHGATSASHAPLRMPCEVAGIFREWLRWHAPKKSARVMNVLYDLRGSRNDDPRFASPMPGLRRYTQLIGQRFEIACAQLGLKTQLPTLDCSRFTAPPPPGEAAAAQMKLF